MYISRIISLRKSQTEYNTPYRENIRVCNVFFGGDLRTNQKYRFYTLLVLSPIEHSQPSVTDFQIESMHF